MFEKQMLLDCIASPYGFILLFFGAPAPWAGQQGGRMSPTFQHFHVQVIPKPGDRTLILMVYSNRFVPEVQWYALPWWISRDSDFWKHSCVSVLNGLYSIHVFEFIKTNDKINKDFGTLGFLKVLVIQFQYKTGPTWSNDWMNKSPRARLAPSRHWSRCLAPWRPSSGRWPSAWSGRWPDTSAARRTRGRPRASSDKSCLRKTGSFWLGYPLVN